MFKTAASRLAHNTTIPALGGNQDLKPLQDLITAEKTVLIALQRLSTDYSKAAEALRTWGQTEGDDLGDILSASATLLIHFSSALSQYAGHGHTIREHLKAIRSREEALDELRRRRRTVHRKADDAEKKLSKMSPEHKNLDTQTELLHRLQDEIRTLDSEIMTEEASLGDFKRTSARSWLGLKFGGLLESSEKGTIIGEYGRLLVAEIPEDVTQPGMPRNLYYGHSKVSGMLNEATRCVNEVTLSDGAPRGPRPLPPKDPNLGSPIMSPIGGPPQYPPTLDYPQPSGQFAPSINTLPTPARNPTLDTSTPVDDFGMRSNDTPTSAARFATFPVKLRQDSLPTHPSRKESLPSTLPPLNPPSLATRQDSFSLSIAEALEGTKDALGDDKPNSWRGRLSGGNGPSPPPSAATNAPPPGGEQTNPWATPPGQSSSLEAREKTHVPQISDDDNALLAYMTSVDEDRISVSEDDHKPPQPRIQEPPKDLGSDVVTKPSLHRPVSQRAEIEDPDDMQHQVKKKQSIPRIPPPTFDPEEEDESKKAQRALDAAAARELARDLDSSSFTPPKVSIASPDHENSADNGPNPNPNRQSLAPSDAPSSEPSREGSPLAPPSAPFAQRAVSPARPSPTEDTQQLRTAAQAYAQAYQDGGSAPPTAAQAYAQSYQNSTSSPLAQSNLPPRFQALQQQQGSDPSLGGPPRFQGTRTGSSPVPPRFQALPGQGSSPVNSSHSGEYQQQQQQQPFGAESRTSFETPYRTPNEYPATNNGGPGSGTTSPHGLANASPLPPGSPPKPPAPSWLQPAPGVGSGGSSPAGSGGPPSPLVPSGRTISAAAFKRPAPHPSASIDYGANSPLGDARRGLPTSPHPPSLMSGASSQSQSYQYGGNGAGAPPLQASPYGGGGGGGVPVGGIYTGPGSSAYQQQQQQPQQQQHHLQNPPLSLQPQSQPPSQFQPHHRSRISRDLPPPPPGAAAPGSRPETEYDYGFDISAYQHSEAGSPLSANFPADTQGGRVQSGYYGGGQQQGQQGQPGGYYGSGGGYGGAQPPPGGGGAYPGSGRYDQQGGLR